MANEAQLDILRQGVDVWNNWRREHYEVTRPDLRGAVLNGADLSMANLSGADLWGANLHMADLVKANLVQSILCQADLSHAHLASANLFSAELGGANMSGTDFRSATLTNAKLLGASAVGADLSGANLSHAYLGGVDARGANFEVAILVRTNMERANLAESRVYGMSAWSLNLDGAIQTGLIVTPKGEADITVDNLDIAQFIYLLLDNRKIRDVIDTVGKKAVLILGRFTEGPNGRKPMLKAIRDKLREYGYLPILFDFDPPRSRDLTETVATLAHLSRFIIADLTEPRSIGHELATVVPHIRSVPVQAIFSETETEKYEYAMYADLASYRWVLPIHRYQAIEDLLADLKDKVIAPAESKADELRLQRGIAV
jgi:uncharacterized protein YjbI with pentapeptide repeats